MTLVGISDIARQYGVSRQTVHKWVRKEGFPAALIETGYLRLWEAEAVQGWYEARAAVAAGGGS